MTSVQQRQNLLSLIDQACADGARLKPACRQIGLSARSVQRWQRTGPLRAINANQANGTTCAHRTSCAKTNARP